MLSIPLNGFPQKVVVKELVHSQPFNSIEWIPLDLLLMLLQPLSAFNSIEWIPKICVAIVYATG